MKNDEMKTPHGSQFWRTGLHRELSEGEMAEWEMQLAAQPGTTGQFHDEVELNRLLRRLPDAPVSSNFTSLVMQAIEYSRRPVLRTRSAWNLLEWAGGWRVRIAFAGLMLLAGFVSFQQYQESQRRELARSILQISTVLPPESLMGDFGVVSGLRRVSVSREFSMDLLDALP